MLSFTRSDLGQVTSPPETVPALHNGDVERWARRGAVVIGKWNVSGQVLPVPGGEDDGPGPVVLSQGTGPVAWATTGEGKRQMAL